MKRIDEVDNHGTAYVHKADGAAAQGGLASHEPKLGDLALDIWRAKIWIIAAALGALLAAFVFVQICVPHYKGTILLSPAAPMTGAETSSMLANDDLFALRFLMQRLGPGQGSDFQRFENIYAGPSVAEILLSDENILQGLSRDRSFIFSSPETRWSAEKLSAYLNKRLRLEPVGTSNARRLVYYHPDGAFAKYMLSAIHHIADGLIRRDIREDSRARVDYLRGAIAQTNNPEHRRTLTTLLMEQERLLMLVSIDQPYAASVIEPAAIGVEPEWPNAPLIYSAAALVFAFFGFLAYGVWRR
tara:strand:- start:732 stop:1634 length:903 start_codon:yes stop_codon:yes gene_type:complete